MSNYVVSVGAMLLDDLKAMNMSQKELSEKIKVPRSVVNEIIKGKRKMSTEFALALEPIMGMPAKYWLDIQTDFEIEQKKPEKYIIGSTKIIKTGKYSAIDTAYWFINRAHKTSLDTGEYLTQLKLQKLLYLAQESSIKLNGEALFFDPIFHWEYGPVVPSVYDAFPKGLNPIINAPKVKLDNKTESFLDNVYIFYEKFSTSGLVTITHNRPAWKNTVKDEEMTLELIADIKEQN